jgi:hypothetical protein
MLNKPNAYNWNGGIGQKQLEWLKKQLKSASDQNQNVILFCHFPVYPAGAHNLWNDQEVIGMIEPFDCVKVFMNGHNHAGEYAQKNGIHYVTVPGVVETKDENAFAVVRVFNDKLVIDGYGRVKDYVIKFR